MSDGSNSSDTCDAACSSTTSSSAGMVSIDVKASRLMLCSPTSTFDATDLVSSSRALRGLGDLDLVEVLEPQDGE